MPPIELLRHLLSLDESTDLFPWMDDLTLANLQAWKIEAQKYASNGDKSHALAVVRCLLRVGDWLEDVDILALGHWAGGNANYLLGQYAEALTHYQLAVAHYRAQADLHTLARVQIGMVGTFSGLQRYAEAERVGAESWAILAADTRRENGQLLASLANNRGIVADRRGRYEEALDWYQYKLTYWQNQPESSQAIAEIGRTRLNMGLVKKRLNLWAEAEMDFRGGRSLLAQLPLESTPQTDKVRGAMHLADLLARRGAAWAEVQAGFAQAQVERAALMTPADELSDLRYLDVLYAEWQIRYGHILPTTAEHLQTLRQQAVQMGQEREVNHLDLLLAECAAQGEDWETAVARYSQLCAILQEEDLLSRAWHRLGQVYAQSGKASQARQTWENGVALIEANRRALSTDYFRSGFLEDKLVIYRDLAALHLTQKAWEIAWQWVERARARELVEWLTGQTFATAEMPDQITASMVCTALPTDTLLLVYALIGETLWVFPLTHEAFHPPRVVGVQPPPHILEQALSQLFQLGQLPLAFVQRRATILRETGQEVLARWYDQLLLPLRDLLAQYAKVVVAPDGFLYRLPFHAFYDAVNGRYLIETHEVQYASGATAWLFASRRKPGRGQSGLFLAHDGSYLHHTNREMEAITAVFPHFTAYSGEAATCERIEEGRTADFIHIAAHASFRADHPLFSGVELANGRLEAEKVLQLRLQASLVCLSACETGRGLLRGGDYLGLVHAFLRAGAGKVLATHWAVDDVTTADLMTAFYRELSAGQTAAAALRAAQRAMIVADEAYLQHPYYWAAFFLFGGADNSGLET